MENEKTPVKSTGKYSIGKILGLLGLGIVGIVILLITYRIAGYFTTMSSMDSIDNSMVAPVADYGYDDEMPMEMSVAEEEVSMKGGVASRSVVPPVSPSAPSGKTYEGERKVIKNATLKLLVEDLDSSIESIKKITEDNEGFLGSLDRSQSTGARADMVVHIPSSSLDKVLKEFKDLAVVVRRENLSGYDVTEEFIDNDARLKNLRREEEQYLKILDKASKVEDILQVEREINRVRRDIESLEGRIKNLESKVSYSKVSISLDEEKSQEQIKKGEWRPWVNMKKEGRIFVKKMQGFVDYLVEFFFGVVAAIPYIILYAVTLLVVGILVKFGWRLLKRVSNRKK